LKAQVNVNAPNLPQTRAQELFKANLNFLQDEALNASPYLQDSETIVNAIAAALPECSAPNDAEFQQWAGVILSRFRFFYKLLQDHEPLLHAAIHRTLNARSSPNEFGDAESVHDLIYQNTLVDILCKVDGLMVPNPEAKLSTRLWAIAYWQVRCWFTDVLRSRDKFTNFDDLLAEMERSQLPPKKTKIIQASG
jgi:hypothetical protein